jgi:hypothetical protein
LGGSGDIMHCLKKVASISSQRQHDNEIALNIKAQIIIIGNNHLTLKFKINQDSNNRRNADTLKAENR